MAAGREIQAHEGVARLQQREEHCLVGLRAGMGLHIGEVAVEQLAGAVDRQLFGDVDIFAAAIIAVAGIAFGIFVGQDRALGFQHRSETMFSDAISSILSRWRVSSSSIAAAIRGSDCARSCEKKPVFRNSVVFRASIDPRPPDLSGLYPYRFTRYSARAAKAPNSTCELVTFVVSRKEQLCETLRAEKRERVNYLGLRGIACFGQTCPNIGTLPSLLGPRIGVKRALLHIVGRRGA